MAVYLEIVDVYAREILDSRGNPTVEAEVKGRGTCIYRACKCTFRGEYRGA